MDKECPPPPLESEQEMLNFRSDKDFENVTGYGAQKMPFSGARVQNKPRWYNV